MKLKTLAGKKTRWQLTKIFLLYIRARPAFDFSPPTHAQNFKVESQKPVTPLWLQEKTLNGE